jgi:hypothetical protein
MQGSYRGMILISRIKQSLPIQRRTELWFDAIDKFINERPAGGLFEILDTGTIVAWENSRPD